MLVVRRNADAEGACCPTALEERTLRLRDDELIEIGEPEKWGIVRVGVDADGNPTDAPTEVKFLAGTSRADLTGDATTPNHQAITAFFVDVDSPGITVRPLHTMHGVDEFCEVYFDDVVVDGARMLGKPGDGWQLAMDLLPYERSTCFWQRIAYLYSRFDDLVRETAIQGAAIDDQLGDVYLALHTLRCRSRATQHRLAEGHKLGPDTSVDKVLLAGAEQLLYDTARNLMPGVIELEEGPWRTEYLYSRAATIYGGTAEVQRNIIARRLLDLGKE